MLFLFNTSFRAFWTKDRPVTRVDGDDVRLTNENLAQSDLPRKIWGSRAY